jgi:U3 small nucleolar RNA-associated protein 21
LFVFHKKEKMMKKRRVKDPEDPQQVQPSAPPVLFQPFRAMGYVTTGLPFSLQALGKELFLTTALDNNFQVYDCGSLNLITVGATTEHPITALASHREWTFVASNNNIIQYTRGKPVCTLL